MRKKLIKQKNGFTLTELVVVMFLLVIITIISASVTLTVNRSKQNYQIDFKSQTEILELETRFKDWLALYDSADYALIIDESSIIASKDGETNYIEFKDGTLSYTSIDDEVKTVKFGSIRNITFEFEGDIVCCRVEFDDTTYSHKILYTMRAAILAESFRLIGVEII